MLTDFGNAKNRSNNWSSFIDVKDGCSGLGWTGDVHSGID